MPKFSRQTPAYQHMRGPDLMNYHQLLYIERKLFKIRLKKYRANAEFLCSLIDSLAVIDLNTKNVIIDEFNLLKAIQADSTKYVSLNALYESKLSQLEHISSRLETVQSVTMELQRTVTLLSKSVDMKSNYIPIMSEETACEILLMSPYLNYRNSIIHLINNFGNIEPQILIDEIFHIVTNIGKDCNLKTPQQETVITLAIYRIVFDEVFQSNPFLNQQFEDVISFVQKQTVAELAIPAEYCPPNMNLEEPPRKSFPKDPFLSKAVSEFNSIVFFTNPIDILNTIKQTVAYLEDAASHYSRYEVQIFPFEVTFGLFMGTVLSSDVTQISGLAEFVEVYTPNNSLSPAFEYSKAGLLACAMQCKKICYIEEDDGDENSFTKGYNPLPICGACEYSEMAAE